jgi:methionyl aminopeptidase
MITIKSPREIETMAAAGRIVAQTLALVGREARPGRSTADLDALAEAFIRGHPGARPSFKGLYDFPATLCTSINEEVVHGIPSPRRVLREGDLLSVDVGVYLEGLHADAAATFAIGTVTPDALRLLQVTRDALAAGIAQARRGITWGTSDTRCRRWPRRRGTGWCGRWWGTASARASTRTRRFPTTASRSAVRDSRRA